MAQFQTSPACPGEGWEGQGAKCPVGSKTLQLVPSWTRGGIGAGRDVEAAGMCWPLSVLMAELKADPSPGAPQELQMDFLAGLEYNEFPIKAAPSSSSHSMPGGVRLQLHWDPGQEAETSTPKGKRWRNSGRQKAIK